MSRRAFGLVEEVPFRLEVNGGTFGAWSCTPEQLDALAAGRLLAEGYIAHPDELLGVAVSDDDGTALVRVQVPAERAAAAAAERRHREAHGCGLLHPLRCAPEQIHGRAGSLPLPDTNAFAELFRALYAAAERYRDTGGIHAAALTDGRILHAHAEDVGRHNAVDKVIGAAFLASHDLSRLGLVLSSRISAEIALKAARAGLSWIASRSIPTTLALQVADVAGLPVVARAPGREPHILRPGADGAVAAGGVEGDAAAEEARP